jgi:La-related protein 7
LPSNVYHELVKRVFSRFGNVTYVSLPKYKSTGQIKGFAFIEFDEEQGALNSIKVKKSRSFRTRSDKISVIA